MRILEFPKMRQTFAFDCGPKALQAVLVYYGIEVRSDVLMRRTRATADGSPVRAIVETALLYGLTCTSKPMTLPEVQRYIDRGIPVILLLQAWAERKPVDWGECWNEGHYVVAIGYDDEKVYFEDPSSFGRTFLTNDELMARWHDRDTEGKEFINHGIALYGREPKYSHKKIEHMD